ncbi:hypothetical protein BU16DRAFT_75365 [Lophium mytilinum]|uniref:Uncharacterized protein n=1 Tax=Lophium mytilinum TaxID=390894 RepID=A0A6A6QLB8_9PEZI|nr:hypothetical protein BU16DRAFT_75365 [Lophium mytilinum]
MSDEAVWAHTPQIWWRVVVGEEAGKRNDGGACLAPSSPHFKFDLASLPRPTKVDSWSSFLPRMTAKCAPSRVKLPVLRPSIGEPWSSSARLEELSVNVFPLPHPAPCRKSDMQTPPRACISCSITSMTDRPVGSSSPAVSLALC